MMKTLPVIGAILAAALLVVPTVSQAAAPYSVTALQSGAAALNA